MTLILLAALGAVFLKGFKEAIGLAVVIVTVYLSLNVVIIVLGHRRDRPTSGVHPAVDRRTARPAWQPAAMLLVALLLFPKLALGLSGFETGVAIMPLVKGDANDDPARPEGGFATPGGCSAPRR